MAFFISNTSQEHQTIVIALNETRSLQYNKNHDSISQSKHRNEALPGCQVLPMFITVKMIILHNSSLLQ